MWSVIFVNEDKIKYFVYSKQIIFANIYVLKDHHFIKREKHICDFPLKLDTWYWWFESKNILKDVVVVLKPESVNRNWMSDGNLETAKLISLHVHATNLRDKIYFSHLREPRSWWRVVNVFSVFTNCLGSVSVPRAPVTVTTRRQETFSGIFIIAFCSQI